MGYKYINKKVSKKFQYFGNIISHYFQKILKTLLILYTECVKLLIIPHILLDYITSYPKFIFYFNDCLEVLDYVYIFVYILSNDY